MSSALKEISIEETIFLRVISYGLKFKDGFTYHQIVSDMRLAEWEKKIIDQYLYYAHLNHQYARQLNQSANIETPFWMISGGSGHQDESCKYIVSYDAQFNYIDYKELQFARENAREARNLSIIAIGISLGALLASILMPIGIAIWMTQTVRIDTAQIQELLNSIRQIPPNIDS